MLEEIKQKKTRLVVGLMSGTSVDGIDAALVEISGRETPRVRLVAFENRPFPQDVREEIFRLFDARNATVDRVGAMNFVLGEIYAESALSVIAKAGLEAGDIDLIGSHGQTIWHEPERRAMFGRNIRYTVQIGEGAVIACRTGIPTVSDFRVADVAAGGLGAPLVPFTEYLLYARRDATILLQNIGGIGNMTVLPAGAAPSDVFAFDTGPGNMIIDAVMNELTNAREHFDRGGAVAARGRVNETLLDALSRHPYYAKPLPKTTGRELFGTQYTKEIIALRARMGISDEDLVATVTDLTAWSVADAYRRYVLPSRSASELIVGGGGSYNPTLLGFLEKRFALLGVAVKTQEQLGFSSDAKEAVAFALMADCCIGERANVLPGVTGADAPSIMGKISLAPKR